MKVAGLVAPAASIMIFGALTSLSSLHDCGHPEGYPKRSQHQTDRKANVRRRLNVYRRITDGIKHDATQKDDHDSARPQADCRRVANPIAPHVVRNQTGEQEPDRDLPDVAEPNSEVTGGSADEENDNLAHSVITRVCSRAAPRLCVPAGLMPQPM